MKIVKIILLTATMSLVAASCNLFGGSGTPNNATAKRAGVLRSANGGTDWQVANTIKDKAEQNLNGTDVVAMKFKPTSSETIYLGSSNNGMLMSDDGGNNWNQILNDFSVFDFAFDPNNADIIYVAGTSLKYGRVLVTKDNGKSWQEIYNEGTTGNPVMSILADSGQRLFIGLEDGNLVQSDDAGLSWRLLYNFKTSVSSIQSYNNSIFLLAKKQGLYRSDDRLTFTNLTPDLGKSQGNLGVFNKVGSYNQFALGVGSIYLATDNGLFKSLDQGVTWSKLVLPVQDQSANILSAGINPSNDNMVYTAVKSTIYKSTDGGFTWQTQNPNTTAVIGTFLVHPQNQLVVYAGAKLK